MHRAAPQPLEVDQGVQGVGGFKLHAIELVFQEQLAPVPVVAVAYGDQRTADVRKVEQQLLFDFGKLPAFDFIHVARRVVAERKQLVLTAEIQREEFVDEREVVVNLANLENLLAAQA